MMRKLILVGIIAMLCFTLTGCGSSSSYSSGSRSSYSSSSSSSKKGYGGYDMPNSSDKNFVDYMKRVDPGLYNSLIGD